MCCWRTPFRIQGAILAQEYTLRLLCSEHANPLRCGLSRGAKALRCRTTVAALLPFPTCLFQESYAFFLGAIEKIYNKDPPLYLSKRISLYLTSGACNIVLWSVGTIPSKNGKPKKAHYQRERIIGAAPMIPQRVQVQWGDPRLRIINHLHQGCTIRNCCQNSGSYESQGLKRWTIPTRPKDHDSRLRWQSTRLI